MPEKLSKEKIKDTFRRFDYNGNGILSLAEIDKAAIEIYPQFADEKPVLMRAYKAADASKDGFIQLNEFSRLIDLLYYYDELYHLFQQLDKNKDKRISFGEFKKGHDLMGITTNNIDELKKEFAKIDTNDGGYILFDEFCIYAAKKKLVESEAMA
ncbi:22176_t:CDS:2 [Dentiscutata erythropus]|uniref:22176_t:CDS:1 n=1 Tax=Dentiscutata erythropus TaxID=1348616 RepID=A0A9N9EWW9_9GLOM|nr:22176_t:CDS:2 [Dentiscutata erythropus]